uniref:MIF4G domain-containing protein n=1 Tax=Alexandrium monilatum TaxID=311494 RepID=A0A7S4W704_9DINO
MAQGRPLRRGGRAPAAMSYAANPNKNRKEKAETEAVAAAKQERADRERIRRLIITLGDDNKKVVGQIKGLVGALEEDVELHGDLMADTVLECAKCLPLKTGIFAAWIARMFDKHTTWASSVITRAFEELRSAVGEGRATVAQLLLRFLVCLGNTGTLALTQVLTLLQQVLALSEGLRPAKGGDLGVYLVLVSLPFISPAARSKAAEKVDAIVAGANAYLASREARWKSLLQILRGQDLPDRLEALASAVRSMQQASWASQAVLHVPGFEPSLEGKPEAPSLEPLGFAAEDVKKSKIRLQVPLVASRFLSGGLANDGADDELSEHDRWVLEDYIVTTIEMFGRDVDECSKQILRIPLLHPHFDAAVIETVFCQMLRLPSPVLLPLFYSRLLECLAEKQASMVKLIEQAYSVLLRKTTELDEECLEVLAEAFAYHLMHNSYTADWSPFTGETITVPSQRFLRRAFERLQRLSFHQNLLHRLPEAVHVHVPPEPLAASSLPAQAKPEFTRILGFVRIKDPDVKKVLKYCRRLLKMSLPKEEPKQEDSSPANGAPAAPAEEGAKGSREEAPAAPAEEGAKRSREEGSGADESAAPEAKKQRTAEAPEEEAPKEEPAEAATAAAASQAEGTAAVKQPSEEDEFGEAPAAAWPLESVAELFTVALLQHGAKTPTHMSKILDGHQQVFAELRPEVEDEAHGFARAVVRCVFDFWRLSGQRLEITLDALLHRGVVTPRAVVEQALAQRGSMGCDSTPVWNMINSVARKSLENWQSVRAELARAKRLGKPEVVDRYRRQLEPAVQETADLFTLVFTGLVRNFQDFEDKDTLRKVTLERVLTIGRKYHAFIKPLIDAAESRIPGVAHNPEIASTFHSLRAL